MFWECHMLNWWLLAVSLTCLWSYVLMRNIFKGHGGDHSGFHVVLSIVYQQIWSKRYRTDLIFIISIKKSCFFYNSIVLLLDLVCYYWVINKTTIPGIMKISFVSSIDTQHGLISLKKKGKITRIMKMSFTSNFHWGPFSFVKIRRQNFNNTTTDWCRR